MTDEEKTKLLEERSRWADLLIKAGHQKRELRLIAWLVGGAGLGLGVVIGRWTKRDRKVGG
jgi:hypothetical protein